jgi:hypothetical protein
VNRREGKSRRVAVLAGSRRATYTSACPLASRTCGVPYLTPPMILRAWQGANSGSDRTPLLLWVATIWAAVPQRVLSPMGPAWRRSHGSLHMAPLFPRSGPGESSSPMSQVVLRCYDFPSRLSGCLFVSLPGSTLPSSVRVSQLALALPEGQRGPSGPGSMFNRRPDCRLALTWT